MSTQACLASCRPGFEYHDYTKKPSSSRHEINRNALELSLEVKGKRKNLSEWCSRWFWSSPSLWWQPLRLQLLGGSLKARVLIWSQAGYCQRQEENVWPRLISLFQSLSLERKKDAHYVQFIFLLLSLLLLFREKNLVRGLLVCLTNGRLASSEVLKVDPGFHRKSQFHLFWLIKEQICFKKFFGR